MSTKVFNTRLQLKYDSYANWSAEEKQFKLLAGEIAVVNVPAETGADGIVHEPAILFKVGDGNKTFNQLPWASGLAADVHAWAKAETKPDYSASEISVVDTANFFEGANVETILAEIWTELKSLTGGEEGAGSIASQIGAGIAALGSATVSEEGKYVTGVSVVDGKLTISEASLPDYSDVYASKALEKTVADHISAVAEYDSRITAAQNKANEAAQAAADANANAETRVKTTDFDAFKTTNTEAINAAASAGTTAAAGVQDNLDAYIESNDAALAGVKATADAAAVKEDVDAAFEAVNDDIKALEEASATHATKTELTNGLATKADKEAFEAVQTTVNNFFSDEAVVNDTIDTLKEIANYIATDKEGAADITARVGALEGKVDVDKVSTAIATAKGEATKYTDDEIAAEVIARDAAIAAAEGRAATDAKNKADAAQAAAEATASADATTKANAAEANAKAYADEKVNALHTVATTGKIEDLEQEVEYIIFNCGTATTLVSDPITE